ncbi:MAG: zinc metallopeptidase [Erysipelotrichaceae bacterium]|jgi:Zn-dependent membrane protease YugP|nr:zinc metallopeptidase [Erysipelotrichaceae bacterium]
MSDYTIYYGLTFLAIIITYGAQLYIQTTYAKFSKIANEKGMTGAAVAKELLFNNDLHGVVVKEVNGMLSDHYDPRDQSISLSQNISQSSSIAAIAVAAHECGHALQDRDKYALLSVRASLVPIANIASMGGYISIMMGLMMGMINLVWFGILLECVILLFQLVTLPVEFDASRRALAQIQQYGYVNDTELEGARTVLRAAALTYVAGVASTLLQILRLVLVYGRRRDRRNY